MNVRLSMAFLVALLAAGPGMGEQEQEQALEPPPQEIVVTFNMAPPVVIPRSVADLNGDTKIDAADVEIAENLPPHDEYWVKFFKNLETSWPEYGHVHRTPQVERRLIKFFVETSMKNAEAKAVALVQWDCSVMGAITFSPVDEEQLRAMRTGEMVFVLNNKTQTWAFEWAERAHFFGEPFRKPST